MIVVDLEALSSAPTDGAETALGDQQHGLLGGREAVTDATQRSTAVGGAEDALAAHQPVSPMAATTARRASGNGSRASSSRARSAIHSG